MSSVRDRYIRLMASGGGTERLEFFSDAVFAIAMTLLVIDLRVPELPEGQVVDAWDVIEFQLPGFFAYALSFWIIAVNWVSHHRKFRVIALNNRGLILLNLLLLFLITFVPFPTSLLAEAPAEFASVALYAGVVGALSLVQLLMWLYARRAGLLSEQVDTELFRFVAISLLPIPVVFGLSILVAWWNPVWAMYFWILLVPINILQQVLEPRMFPQPAR
jgi:uncharacterized membrane protein